MKALYQSYRWPFIYVHRLAPRTERTPKLGRQSQRAPCAGIACVATASSSYELTTYNRGLASVQKLANAWSVVARRLPLQNNSDDNNKYEALIIGALKLALAWLQHPGVLQRPDGRQPLARAASLAAMLAELSSAGIPLDAEAIAAGVVTEAVVYGGLDILTIQDRLGPEVAGLVHDVLRIRTAPQRVELYDDSASSAIREWCLAFHDVRANALEVASRWDDLQHMVGLPFSDQQIMALEALQLFAPLGHALGLGAVSARVEDLCFKVLFPSSYSHTSEWLRDVVDEAEDSLFACQQQLLAALDDHPQFKVLASSCVIRARTKSLFSIMKKILRLEDLSKGGRQREQIYDVLGMRAVVQARTDLPPAEAEARAVEACYIVQEVAESLWLQVPGRSKDYIAQPKRNGYRSIHLTMHMQRLPGAAPQRLGPLSDAGAVSENASRCSYDISGQMSSSSVGSNLGMQPPYLELQIRTQHMDDLAEAGEASHASYKGGLDSRQARQLREWTEQLRQRLAMRPHSQMLLPSGVPSTGFSRDSERPSEHDDIAAQALFSNWDSDGNGVISVQELREQLRELGDSVTMDDAQALMSLLSQEQQVTDETKVTVGERGITLQEFSSFVKKVSLVGALDRLDKQQAQDLQPVKEGY